MEKNLGIINFEYKEVNNKTIYFKLVSALLSLVFLAKPLSELIDVFRREFFIGWCCLLPCPSPFSGYYFI
ncbi:hypothetical protein [uncultured Tenacibaculum sp.]|uniref:hypothetical protein n=1 Tax=uncultured Tenacibaculum sp. TaxID=174713 RepID=UPI0026239C79|nr:hypothetical protein [uncultured Tenacibaculum sp.]